MIHCIDTKVTPKKPNSYSYIEREITYKNKYKNKTATTKKLKL